MKRFMTILAGVLVAFTALCGAARAATTVPERSIGDARAPVVIDEYVDLTCPHCADFYLHVLPEIEKRYVKPGKARMVLHDYPLNGLSLKAASLARCMPADEYFPFIQVLYENQQAWATATNPEKTLVQYARLGGLDEERAKFCLNDTNMQNAIVADRTAANEAYTIESTPTFIFNKGVEKMAGTGSIDVFAATIDRMLAHAK